ncbi:MAG: sugar ABC transporter ATP-binding protein [Verrucomicrobia bacterium]|nr:sugar ABC transporter ATP-binding protein [Verrucomicrobiota bacterium]
MSSARPSTQRQVSQNGVILSVENITKVFPGTTALDGVNFKVYGGKVNVLVGENGAGKSTLMKILAGVELPTSGCLIMDGHEVIFKNTREAAKAGVGIIYQELNLFPNLNIAENIFAGREITRADVIDHGAQEKLARKILDRLEQPLNPRTLVSDLRMGQQQIVEIAKALSQDVRVLIMDEPTSALTTAETEALFQIIEELKGHGVAIVYISHKLEELLRIGDFVTVLRDGKVAAEAPAADVDITWIIEKMVGRTVRAPSRTHGAARQNGHQLLKVQNLTLPREGKGFTLRRVSFSLREGEILAIYGLMGAGRTELFECLMGLHTEATGTITLAGKALRHEPIFDRIASGITLVPEDRQRLGLVQQLSVAQNITLASLRHYLRSFWISDREERTSVARIIKELAIKVRSPEQPITSLSGGNQQKVVVAKSLLTRPKVLLLDEPTRGIDVGAKAEIFQIINRLANEGLGILFVSSELPEVLAVPDRILVLSRGRVSGVFGHAEVTEERLVRAASAHRQTDLVGVEESQSSDTSDA